MKHFQFAIASIVDANTGHGLPQGGGGDYRAQELRSRSIRSQSVHALLGAIAQRVRDNVTAYRDRLRQRRAIEELAQLSDHYLDDIGLTRGDIAAVRLGQSSLELLNAERRARLAAASLDNLDTHRVDTRVSNADAVNEEVYAAAKCA
jgi:uncharacterized protein YjiS (DUF1127 family)